MNESPAVDIRDIAPPVDVFPYPMWMVIVAAALALALLGFGAWLLWRWWRSRPGPPPPDARSIARGRLRDLSQGAEHLDPYVFSIKVSDVLRSYLTAQYGLRATRQTSPEFLAAISNSPGFSAGEKTLLRAFLEKCDLIKFARVEVDRSENRSLLDQAVRVVEGSAI